jgi:hypothetical protein
MDLNDISKKIAALLEINQCQMSVKLAEAGLAYLSLRELKANAPLIRKRKGNRAHIHTQQLLVDCAEILQGATGVNGKEELSRVGPRNEHNSTIIQHAKVVLSVLGLAHNQSMQQQARNAAKQIADSTCRLFIVQVIDVFAFWNVLPDQTISIFVEASLPRVIRVSEEPFGFQAGVKVATIALISIDIGVNPLGTDASLIIIVQVTIDLLWAPVLTDHLFNHSPFSIQNTGAGNLALS